MEIAQAGWTIIWRWDNNADGDNNDDYDDADHDDDVDDDVDDDEDDDDSANFINTICLRSGTN